MKTREIADSYRTQSASLFNALIEARKSANEAISKTYEGVSLNGAYRDIADTIYTFTGAGVVHPTVLAMLYETRGLIQKAWEANGLKGIIALVDSNILQERNGRDSFWNIFAESAIRGKEAKRVYPKNLKTASRLELLRFVSSDQWTANPGKERKSAVVVLNSSSNEARAETYCLMHDKLILDMMPGLIAKLGDKSDGAANPSQILDASFKELTLPLCKEWINGLKGYVMTSGYEYQLTDMLELPEIYDIQNSTLPFYNSYEMYSKVLSIWRREFIKEVEKTKNAKQDAKGKGPGGTSIDRAVSSAINSELVNQNVNPAVSFKEAQIQARRALLNFAMVLEARGILGKTRLSKDSIGFVLGKSYDITTVAQTGKNVTDILLSDSDTWDGIYHALAASSYAFGNELRLPPHEPFPDKSTRCKNSMKKLEKKLGRSAVPGMPDPKDSSQPPKQQERKPTTMENSLAITMPVIDDKNALVVKNVLNVLINISYPGYFKDLIEVMADDELASDITLLGMWGREEAKPDYPAINNALSHLKTAMEQAGQLGLVVNGLGQLATEFNSRFQKTTTEVTKIIDDKNSSAAKGIIAMIINYADPDYFKELPGNVAGEMDAAKTSELVALLSQWSSEKAEADSITISAALLEIKKAILVAKRRGVQSEIADQLVGEIDSKFTSEPGKNQAGGKGVSSDDWKED